LKREKSAITLLSELAAFKSKKHKKPSRKQKDEFYLRRL